MNNFFKQENLTEEQLNKLTCGLCDQPLSGSSDVYAVISMDFDNVIRNIENIKNNVLLVKSKKNKHYKYRYMFHIECYDRNAGFDNKPEIDLINHPLNDE